MSEMSRPVQIGQVTAGMSLPKYAQLTEQAERMAQVNLRLAQIEAREKAKAAAHVREVRAIAGLGRCEYVSLRHAQWKESLYQRAIRREEWDAFQMRKLQARFNERQAKKNEWVEFDPEAVEVSLDHIPDF